MRTFWTSCCDVEWWGVDWRRRVKRRQAASFPSVFFVMRQLMEKAGGRGVQIILTKGDTEGTSTQLKLRKMHGCHKHILWYSCKQRRLCRLQSGYASHAADGNISPLPGIELKILGRPNHSLMTIPIAPSRLHDKKMDIFR